MAFGANMVRMKKSIIPITLLLFTTGAMVSCDDASGAGKYTNLGVFVPTNAIVARISLNVLPLPTFTGACPLNGTFPSAVDLVVTPSRDPFSIGTVTLHMIDGSNLGGPGITFPTSQLVQMFGTTSIVQRRIFTFRPEFTCHGSRPQSIKADVIVIDGSGMARGFEATAAFPK